MKNIKYTIIYFLILSYTGVLFTQCKSVDFTVLGFIHKKYEKEALMTMNIDSVTIETSTLHKIDSLITKSDIIIKDTTGLLTGVILDYNSNTPISNALITIYGYVPIISDSNGNFQSPKLQNGSYYIIVENEGYITNAMKFEIINGWKMNLIVKLIKINAPIKIGTQGGIVKVSDGAKIYIPKNALQKETEISATIIPLDAYYKGLSPMNIEKPFINIYKLLPDGLMFAKEIKISMPIQNTIKNLNGMTSNDFQSLHIRSSDFNPEELTEKIKSFNKISENGDTLLLKMNRFPKSMIWPISPPGFMPCNRKCGPWELGTKLSKESLRIENCAEGLLSVSFGFDWYFGASASYSQTLKAPCCMKMYIKGSLQNYDMDCSYDLCDYSGNVWSKDYFWETRHKADNIDIQTVIIPCCEGNPANPVCCEKNTQCYKWICSGGAAKKVELPICEECRKQCKECDPQTGTCINYKCSPNQKCCNGVCIDKVWKSTTIVTTCDGPSDPIVSYSNTEPTNCGTTGQLEYSFSVCVGGSTTTITCSEVPCGE